MNKLFSKMAGCLLLSGVSHSYAVDTTPVTTDLVIKHGWIRLLPPTMKTSAAYFELYNTSNKPRTLVSASTTRAERTEFHETRQMDDLSSMQKIPLLVIPAGGKLVFNPGEKHLMLIKLTSPLQKDERIPLQFQFNNGEVLSADFIVRKDDGGASEEDEIQQGHSAHHHQH